MGEGETDISSRKEQGLVKSCIYLGTGLRSLDRVVP
jgi:hypothetical protein